MKGERIQAPKISIATKRLNLPPPIKFVCRSRNMWIAADLLADGE
jgi:hypothetical protein